MAFEVGEVESRLGRATGCCAIRNKRGSKTTFAAQLRGVVPAAEVMVVEEEEEEEEEEEGKVRMKKEF